MSCIALAYFLAKLCVGPNPGGKAVRTRLHVLPTVEQADSSRQIYRAYANLARLKRLSELHVITRYWQSNINLRTQLLWIIKRAGVKPWPKLFQNLRATRATELADEFTSRVAAGSVTAKRLPISITAKQRTSTLPKRFNSAQQMRCSSQRKRTKVAATDGRTRFKYR
jgi:hypothetical protein